MGCCCHHSHLERSVALAAQQGIGNALIRQGGTKQDDSCVGGKGYRLGQIAIQLAQ